MEETTLHVARRLVEYCRTHTQDPDNALIGMQVNLELFHRCYEPFPRRMGFKIRGESTNMLLASPLRFVLGSSS